MPLCTVNIQFHRVHIADLLLPHNFVSVIINSKHSSVATFSKRFFFSSRKFVISSCSSLHTLSFFISSVELLGAGWYGMVISNVFFFLLNFCWISVFRFNIFFSYEHWTRIIPIKSVSHKNERFFAIFPHQIIIIGKFPST